MTATQTKLKRTLLGLIVQADDLKEQCYEAIRSMEGGQPSSSKKTKQAELIAAKVVENRRAKIRAKARQTQQQKQQ